MLNVPCSSSVAKKKRNEQRNKTKIRTAQRPSRPIGIQQKGCGKVLQLRKGKKKKEPA